MRHQKVFVVVFGGLFIINNNTFAAPYIMIFRKITSKAAKGFPFCDVVPAAASNNNYYDVYNSASYGGGAIIVPSL